MPPALAQEKYEKNATCTWWLQSIHEKKMKNITENKNVRKMPPALAREKNEKTNSGKKGEKCHLHFVAAILFLSLFLSNLYRSMSLYPAKKKMLVQILDGYFKTFMEF